MYECKIAEKLVSLRMSKGVTQEEVAQSLSVSNKTVSKWENGSSMPDLSMLVELSKYYGVTTDALLGLSAEKKRSTKEELCSSFKELERREGVLKAFEIIKSIIPAMMDGKVTEYNRSTEENIFPPENPLYHRSEFKRNYFFEFIASSKSVNVAVMLLRNEANFEWLKNSEKQKSTVKLFKFLSDEDTLSVLYFIHSSACSDSFTADYIAKNTGVNESRASEILDEFCSVGECSSAIAHLSEGTVKVYECFGDGVILSILSLAYEKMCGKSSYEYYNGEKCKMIGGK